MYCLGQVFDYAFYSNRIFNGSRSQIIKQYIGFCLWYLEHCKDKHAVVNYGVLMTILCDSSYGRDL